MHQTIALPVHTVWPECKARLIQLDRLADQRDPVGHVMVKQYGSQQSMAAPQWPADVGKKK